MVDWKNKLFLRLPAIGLLCAAVLFWSVYDRYEPAGPILLSAPNRSDATRIQGDCSGDEGVYVLHVPEGGQGAEIRVPVPGSTEYQRLRVRARMKLDRVVAGAHPWDCARLLLLQYDVCGQWLSGEYGSVAEKGTQDWKMREDVFDILPSAATVDVALQHIGRSGTVAFEQIEVQPVKFRRSFWWMQGLFLVLWLGAGILYFPRCRLNTRKLKVLIVLNVIAVLAGTLMPGKLISHCANWLKESVAQTQSVPVPAAGEAISSAEHACGRVELAVDHAHEIGHYLLFASLCFLVYLSAALERQHPVYFLKVGFDVMLFACITEVLQFLTLDRSSSFGDLLIDVYGMATALLLFLCVLPMVHRRLARNA